MLNNRRRARRRHALPVTHFLPDAICCTQTHVPMRSMPSAETRIARFSRTHRKVRLSSQACACSTCRCRRAARKGRDRESVRLRSRLSHSRSVSRASCPGAREPQARVRVKKRSTESLSQKRPISPGIHPHTVAALYEEHVCILRRQPGETVGVKRPFPHRLGDGSNLGPCPHIRGPFGVRSRG